MSDCRIGSCDRASRRRFAATLAALAVMAGAACAWAQKAAPVGASAPANAAKNEAAPRPPPVPKARTPRQMAEEIIPILKRQKTPWQLYPSYEQIFTEFAEKEKALAPANAPNDPHAKRAEQLRAMAALLASMGEQAKVQHDIKRGQSTVPPEKRQSTFSDAGKELTRLLAEFTRQAATLPPGK